MNLEYSKGPSLLPSEYDVGALRRYQDEFYRAAEELDEGLRRSLFWTIRLSMEVESEWRKIKNVPGFKYLAIGFFDPEHEMDAFGVIVFAASSLSTLERPEDEIPSFIHVDGHEFPVTVRRVRESLHQFDSHPSGGTGACWATSRISSNPVGPGILTAKHAVGSILGTSVQLSCGCTGVVDDVGPDGIDAALVVSSCSQTPQMLHPKQLIAPWIDVSFEGASSGARYTKVSAVTDTMGILNDAALPSRVFLASPGRGGDSGALVKESTSGNPVGIYMGGYSNPSGQVGGIAQHAYQAATLMDMELYL